MALTPEITAAVENMMAGLNKDEFERPGTTQQKFLDHVLSINAQMVTDRASLVNAGFDDSKVDLYLGMQEILMITYGQRYGLTETPEQKVAFDQKFSIAEKDRKRMLIVARHIVEKTGDKKIARHYKQIVKGNSIVDTLTDNLSLGALIDQNQQISSEIKPGGIAIDTTYTANATKLAIELLAIKGFVVEKGTPVSAHVDRLNRIVTLCVRAITDIRKFAEAAFIDDPEYLRKNYPALSGSTQKNDPLNQEIEEPVPAETEAADA
jgi:hypothetical protein